MSSGNPWHLLHAIRILCKVGKPKEADEMLQSCSQQIENLVGYSSVRREVLKANVGYETCKASDNPWTHAKWVRNRLDLGQIHPDEAIQKLYLILDQEPNIHQAFTDSCHLLFIEQRLQDVILLCDRIFSTATETSRIERKTSVSINPKLTQSMALTTKAWAIFCRDRDKSSREVEILFQKSFKLHPNNAWWHNWRGLFLHATERESGIAENELRKAISLNKKTPPFYRNLARVILETNSNPFIRNRNKEVIDLCHAGLLLCRPESYWNWGGLRAELAALQYYAKSLEHLPDQITFLGHLGIDLEIPEISWYQ
jgi:tetratricopeptide (TPR) repeat protein